MDAIVEKLSNLESIWRLTTEVTELEDEFDIFDHKSLETKVISHYSKYINIITVLEDNWSY